MLKESQPSRISCPVRVQLQSISMSKSSGLDSRFATEKRASRFDDLSGSLRNTVSKLQPIDRTEKSCMKNHEGLQENVAIDVGGKAADQKRLRLQDALEMISKQHRG